MKSIGNCKCVTFNEFISDTLTQENNDKIYAASKNRKRNFEAGASQSKAPMVSKTPYCPPNANVRTAHLRRRTKLKPVSTKGIQFPCRRIPLGRVAPMFHQQTCRARTVTSLVIGQIDVPILPRMLKETSVRGVFTILQWRKFLLVKWSPLVSSLLMITLQLFSLIRVLRTPL